jgi:phosphate/sulfate permease
MKTRTRIKSDIHRTTKGFAEEIILVLILTGLAGMFIALGIYYFLQQLIIQIL